MEKLVEIQGNYDVFFSSFLELERRNLVSILAFDSRSIKSLLVDKNVSYFTRDFPIFYANQHPVTHGKYNALDVALEHGQLRALDCIVNHICKYQNYYTSSYLFKLNLIPILELGIDLENLMCSKVFEYEFELEEWPSVSTCDKKMRKPYNGTIF